MEYLRFYDSRNADRKVTRFGFTRTTGSGELHAPEMTRYFRKRQMPQESFMCICA